MMTMVILAKRIIMAISIIIISFQIVPLSQSCLLQGHSEVQFLSYNSVMDEIFMLDLFLAGINC